VIEDSRYQSLIQYEISDPHCCPLDQRMNPIGNTRYTTKIKQGNKNSKTLLIIQSNNKKVNLLKIGMWVFEINCNFITRLKILIQKGDARNWVSTISCDFMRKEGSYPNYDPHLGN
jgi:hypothetical protein